ncbi:hypothetical protein D3C85_1689240 [compost metagenome]
MREAIVKLSDREMAKLEAVARERRVGPDELLKNEAIKAIATTRSAAHVRAAPQEIASVLSQDEAKAQRRQARLTILMRSNGIFSGDKDKPKDGLVYQKALRAEWQ